MPAHLPQQFGIAVTGGRQRGSIDQAGCDTVIRFDRPANAFAGYDLFLLPTLPGEGIPRVLLEATTDRDRAAAKRAMAAMMTMRKIDIATIEAARRG